MNHFDFYDSIDLFWGNCLTVFMEGKTNYMEFFILNIKTQKSNSKELAGNILPHLTISNEFLRTAVGNTWESISRFNELSLLMNKIFNFQEPVYVINKKDQKQSNLNLHYKCENEC